MATIKVLRPFNVEDVYITVTCPECDGTVHMKLKGPRTNKTCPKCNTLTYIVTITTMRGYISVNVLTVGRDETPNEYELLSEDVEIDYQEDDGSRLYEE